MKNEATMKVNALIMKKTQSIFISSSLTSDSSSFISSS